MGKKIVLCSNSITVQKVVKWSLTEFDFEIVTIVNKGDTADILRKFTPDLFIIDQDISDSEGISLCKELKSSPAHAQIPIILLMQKKKDSQKTSDIGGCNAEKILFMPFESRDLVGTISDLFRAESSETAQSQEENKDEKEPLQMMEPEIAMIEPENREAPFISMKSGTVETLPVQEIIFKNKGIKSERMCTELKEEAGVAEPLSGNKMGEYLRGRDAGGFEHFLSAWIKDVAQQEIKKIVEGIVPGLTKEIVQENLGRLMDKENLDKISCQNRELISTMMADKVPYMVREMTEKMVPNIAERLIREEIEHIKQGDKSE